MATDQIEVIYKAVTPMFCGGVTPASAEVRLPSFKGVLRWWWRALAWSRYRGNLKEVSAAEDILFGSSRGGRGKVIMRLLPSIAPIHINKGAVLKLNEKLVGEGARYLGYGVIEAFARKAKDNRAAIEPGQLMRDCLQAPLEVRIEFRVRDVEDPARASLLDALKAVGVLGAIGAKSRKGYGSLVLESILLNGKPLWQPPATVTDLCRAIRELIAGNMTSKSDELAKYTALSTRTRIVLVSANGKTDSLAHLDRIGREMMLFRAWGKDGIIMDRSRDPRTGEVSGVRSERNFKDDHDLMKKVPSQRFAHPRRIVFGLPHNYGKNADQQVVPAAHHLDRRASPLLIHIHECAKQPVAVLSLLPSQFLPDGDNAVVNVGGSPVKIASENDLWKPANEFLDRLLDETRRKESFGTVLEVKP